jgi:HEAT repeat protein
MSDALETLLNAIAVGDDARTEEAALALGRRGDAALPPLRDLLADPNPDHRWWAARALAAVGTPAARELLVATLADPDHDVRAAAAQGLGDLRAAEAVAGLIRCMATSSPAVSGPATNSPNYRSTSIVRGRTVNVRRIASDSLARIGAPAVPALIAALQEGDASTRSGAARALSIIQPEEAIPALCAALDDPSAIVTHYAEEALERMGVGLVLFRP